MPLPPYIKRDKPAQGGIWDKYNDKENYQTIYARFEGAVAAPTAGLHFTDRVFRALEEKGVEKVFVTLHVGAGTFLPVKTADTKDHKMHTEYCEISPEACDAVNRAKAEGRRIIAVGTTSLRLLETAADEQGVLHPSPATPAFSSRPDTSSAQSTCSSPTSTCRSRLCSC